MIKFFKTKKKNDTDNHNRADCIDTKQILKDFYSYAFAKKEQSVYMKCMTIISIAVIALVLYYTNGLLKNMANKILVVNEGGEYVQVRSENQDKLYESLLISHCANTVYYLNSFDRLNITQNQARALFLVNKKDANTIFAKYQSDRAYGDALDLGVIYKTKFEKILSVSVSGDEYTVEYTSVMDIINGKETKRFQIISKGVAVRTTPQYPENTSGFFFRQYSQEYQLINNEER